MIIYLSKEKEIKGSILFIHGMCHGAWCWDQGFMHRFVKAGYHCYAIDLSGHQLPGKQKSVNQYALNDYLDDILTAVQKIGEPPILVGHSMGGFLVQKYLEDHEQVKAAILLGSVPYYGILRGAIRYIFRHPFAIINLITKDIYGPFVRNAKELYFQGAGKMEIAPYQKLMRSESYKALIEMMFTSVKPHDSNIPMLCIGGKKDRIISKKEVKRTAAFHSADLQMLSYTGHNMMLDNGKDAVQEIMLKWIDQLD